MNWLTDEVASLESVESLPSCNQSTSGKTELQGWSEACESLFDMNSADDA